MDFGAGDLGFTWELDPIKHRAVAKKFLPAFSTKAIKGMEHVIHIYVDLFMSRIKSIGEKSDGLLINDVCSPPLEQFLKVIS
jgi:hypothetical protein